MTLRARLFFALFLATLVPATVLGMVVRTTVGERVGRERAEMTRLLARAAEAQVDHEVRRRSSRLADACRTAAPIRALLDGMGRDTAAHWTVDHGELGELARSLELEQLDVYDLGRERSRALVATTRRPATGGSVDVAKRAVDRPVAVEESGQPSLAVACTAEETGATLLVAGTLPLLALTAALGGTRADAPLPVRWLERGEPMPEGAVEIARFHDARGGAGPTMIALTPAAATARLVEDVDAALATTAGLALALAVLLGTLLAISVTRPLADLERAAERVAGGDLESTIAGESDGEVGRALGAFNRMTHELRATRVRLLRAERLAAWRDIARRIAHEIKNPLSPIQLSIETMRKTYAQRHPEFDEIFDESTRAILEEVHRLRRIVDEFSRFARLPAPKPSSVDVAELVAHVVALHAGGTVAVKTRLATDLPPVRADREQLVQVLVNVLQNAIDAAAEAHPGAGKVELEARREPGHGAGEDGVHVSIEDDGRGVPESERALIFEPYFTKKAGGTGLGLAIAARIVDEHGGALYVEASRLGGAAFHLVLRRAGPRAAATSEAGIDAAPRRET